VSLISLHWGGETADVPNLDNGVIATCCDQIAVAVEQDAADLFSVETVTDNWTVRTDIEERNFCIT
jgi:hypothetical protein